MIPLIVAESSLNNMHRPCGLYCRDSADLKISANNFGSLSGKTGPIVQNNIRNRFLSHTGQEEYPILRMHLLLCGSLHHSCLFYSTNKAVKEEKQKFLISSPRDLTRQGKVINTLMQKISSITTGWEI